MHFEQKGTKNSGSGEIRVGDLLRDLCASVFQNLALKGFETQRYKEHRDTASTSGPKEIEGSKGSASLPTQLGSVITDAGSVRRDTKMLN